MFPHTCDVVLRIGWRSRSRPSHTLTDHMESRLFYLIPAPSSLSKLLLVIESIFSLCVAQFDLLPYPPGRDRRDHFKVVGLKSLANTKKHSGRCFAIYLAFAHHRIYHLKVHMYYTVVTGQIILNHALDNFWLENWRLELSFIYSLVFLLFFPRLDCLMQMLMKQTLLKHKRYSRIKRINGKSVMNSSWTVSFSLLCIIFHLFFLIHWVSHTGFV